MHLRSRFFFLAKRFAAVMLIAFALWLGLNLLFPPHRANWPKALDQTLSSSVVFLISDSFQNRVRGWLQKAPRWLLVPVRLPTRRLRPSRMKEARWTPDAES